MHTRKLKIEATRTRSVFIRFLFELFHINTSAHEFIKLQTETGVTTTISKHFSLRCSKLKFNWLFFSLCLSFDLELIWIYNVMLTRNRTNTQIQTCIAYRTLTAIHWNAMQFEFEYYKKTFSWGNWCTFKCNLKKNQTNERTRKTEWISWMRSIVMINIFMYINWA